MRRARVRGYRAVALAVLATALVLGGCGRDEVDPHGMSVPPLEDVSRGEAITLGAHPIAGVWLARVEIEVTVRQARDAAVERGLAHLEIREEITKTDTGFASVVDVRLIDATGPAEIRVRDLGEGVRVRVQRSASGRPMADTIRYEGEPSPFTREFFSRLHLAGFGGSPPWWPDRALRAGEIWTVDDLHLPGDAARRATPPAGTKRSVPPLARTGGLRLESLEGDGADRVATIRIESLDEVKGPLGTTPGDAVDLGLTVRGILSLSVDTGRPRAWEITQRLRTHWIEAGEEQRGDTSVTVRATVRPAPPGRAPDDR